MNKKLKISILFIIFMFMIFNISYAKYSFNKDIVLNVYIDKTPPTISVTSNNRTENFNKTETRTYTKTVTIKTSDNIKIDYNEYFYNSSSNNFEGITSKRFTTKLSLTNEGFYKVIAHDTSGNITEFYLIIDKSAPNVNVTFYKKGDEPKDYSYTNIIKFAAKELKLLSPNIINSTEENKISENNIVNEIENTVENSIENKESVSNKISDENEIIENNVEKSIIEDEPEITENETKSEIKQEEETEIIEQKPKKMMLGAGYTAGASNEGDFRNALNNRASTIITYASINFTSPLYINYPVTVTCGTNENALRYTAYDNFIIVQNGGALTLNGMVVDCRQFAGNHGINCINVQAGGSLTFGASTIIDGGLSNVGVLVNSGATVTYNSGQIAYTGKGIRVVGNGNLVFNNLGDGRTHEFWNNTTAISFEGFTGTCNINQNNFKIRNGTDGIIFEYGSGIVNMTSGYIYSNSDMGIIMKEGTLNFGGDAAIYSNTNYGIDCRNANVNVSGGSIFSNGSGVLLKTDYNSKFKITAGNIYSNSLYSIKNNQNGDGNCTVLGGGISGPIYLGQNDNYVNTNSNYPSFTVTPSTYWYKRKLVRTTSNAYANNEINNVTMTASSGWYKYVEDEYIKVWNNCNIKIVAKDYFGNVLKTETRNGTLGQSYSITPFEIDGYDLINIPSNANGNFTQAEITIEFQYDLKNVAIVNYSDSLSGIKSAKYWYNANSNTFTGNGYDLTNNKLFTAYGYYKVVVENDAGLKKEYSFTLNKDSKTR